MKHTVPPTVRPPRMAQPLALLLCCIGVCPLRGPPSHAARCCTVRLTRWSSYLRPPLAAGWTALPGRQMDAKGGGNYEVTLPNSAIEFVITNGDNEWDTPPPPPPGKESGWHKNYTIHTPGTYALSRGRIEKLA